METATKITPIVKAQQPDDRLILPGAGLPLDFTPMALNQYGVKTRSLFPTVLDDRDIEAGYIDQPVLTLREKKMLQLMNEFTDIENWYEKIFDNNFIKKWKDQTMQDKCVSQKMLEWVVVELSFKAKIARKTGFVNVFNGDVVKSCANFFHHDEFQRELCKAIFGLEQGLEAVPEYRMATEKREFDFVHPAFFPVVFGKTRILRDRTIGIDDAIDYMGKGEVLQVPQDAGPSRQELSWNIASRSDIISRPYSSKFQWLPSDVYFRPDGTCYFASYINNIHPKRDRHIYPVLEKLLDKVIPMFDMTLTPVKNPVHPQPRIELQEVLYEEIKPGKTGSKPTESRRECRETYEDRLLDWRKTNFNTVQPEPGDFAPTGIPPQIVDELPSEEKNKHRIADVMDLKREYGHRGLQVIVRIAQQSPTPEDPEFVTPWHTEGQINEHICASAIYYFEMNNMESVRLGFRQVSDIESFQDLSYEKGDTLWLEQIFGMKADGPAVQEVGSIECSQGRMVTWPNTLQHNAHLSLKDRTKPGRVHAVNFMLVDPNIRIISTANVPPQRLDWKSEADQAGVDITKLSLEEKLKIVPREGDFPWALQEAREILAENREERKKFNHYQNVAFNSKDILL